MPLPISTATAEHYLWGDGCHGWHLLRGDDLSVIEERVPPGRAEIRHLHTRSHQFFYILHGAATLEIDGVVYTVHAGEGIDLPPGHPHQLRNDGDIDLHFLVISAPKSHGDRIPA